MKLIFKEVNDNDELDRLSQEVISEIPKAPTIEMAYPDVFHPSSLLSNFNVRDDSKTIAAFKNGQLAGLASLIWSKQTFLPPSFLNRVFFILRLEEAKDIEDELMRKVESIYAKLNVSEISYIRTNPVEKLSPTERKLGKHGYNKKFSMRRMARTLDNIPKLETELTPSLRRVRWEEQDLMLFMKTWARGFGWLAKYIEPASKGMTRRLLERNRRDPNTWINFLVEIEGQPVGTAAFLTFPKSAYVVNVSTLKKFRKRGIATRTMINLMEWCEAKGMKYITLDVEADENAALNLYKKLDFKEYGESAGYVKKFNHEQAH
ncbi:MAG: GNAT family N-acetyltransferase [Candidatus Bathyarchaeia archaeon]